jgi:hypothetical protein
MRNKVCRFLREAAKQFSDDPVEQRKIYRNLKKAHAGSSVKAKHLAYTIMLKPELLDEIRSERD